MPAAERLEAQLGRTGVVDLDQGTGTPRFVARLDGFLTGQSGRTPEEIVRSYVRLHPDVFGLSAADLDGIRLARSWTASGYTHLVFEQHIDGIPVIHRGLVANVLENGNLINLSGAPVSGLRANTLDPRVESDNAVAIAFRAHGEQPPRAVSTPGSRQSPQPEYRSELVLDPVGAEARLAWRVYGVDRSHGGFSAIVDAVTGPGHGGHFELRE
jgi:hypothetical protein